MRRNVRPAKTTRRQPEENAHSKAHVLWSHPSPSHRGANRLLPHLLVRRHERAGSLVYPNRHRLAFDDAIKSDRRAPTGPGRVPTSTVHLPEATRFRYQSGSRAHPNSGGEHVDRVPVVVLIPRYHEGRWSCRKAGFMAGGTRLRTESGRLHPCRRGKQHARLDPRVGHVVSRFAVGIEDPRAQQSAHRLATQECPTAAMRLRSRRPLSPGTEASRRSSWSRMRFMSSTRKRQISGVRGSSGGRSRPRVEMGGLNDHEAMSSPEIDQRGVAVQRQAKAVRENNNRQSVPYEFLAIFTRRSSPRPGAATEHHGQVVLGPFDNDRPAARKSFRKFADIEMNTVCFGHGQPLVGEDTNKLKAASKVGTRFPTPWADQLVVGLPRHSTGEEARSDHERCAIADGRSQRKLRPSPCLSDSSET